MRKWMRERMQRGKKGGDGKSQEPANAPTPLQPKYYDSEPAEPKAEAPAPEPQAAPEPEPEAAPSANASSETAGSRTRPSRRRRGRGGRSGRGRTPRGQAATGGAPGETSAAAESPISEAGVPEPAIAPVAAAEAGPAPVAASKGTVILAIGLPGSGKSSWFKRHNILPLSSDLLRQLLFDDAEEQRFQDLVFSNLRSMLKARLIARRPLNYVDATNLTPHDRQSWIKLARDYGYDVQGLYFDVPLEICLERNHKRARTVGDDVMRRMSAKLKAPTFDEGFSKITVVRVKKKDNVEDPGDVAAGA